MACPKYVRFRMEDEKQVKAEIREIADRINTALTSLQIAANALEMIAIRVIDDKVLHKTLTEDIPQLPQTTEAFHNTLYDHGTGQYETDHVSTTDSTNP